MHRLVVADPLEPEVVAALGELGEVRVQPPDLAAALDDATVLIVRSATRVTAALLATAPHLVVVARAGVGLDNVDADACAARGVAVVNTPQASTNAVAELTIACLLNVLRHVPRAHHLMKRGVWAKRDLLGREATGQTLGIVGLGRIGAAVASKALALGLTVYAYSQAPRAIAGVTSVTLDQLLAAADVISLHATLTDRTRHLVNAETIAKMKDGVCLLNLARGELVDEDALYAACRSGKVAAAALDVFSREPYDGKLLELDNVYVTPHLGASTREAQRRIGQDLVAALRQALGSDAAQAAESV